MGELAQLGPRTGHPGVEPRRAVETGNRPRDPYPLQAVTRATPGVRAGPGRGGRAGAGAFGRCGTLPPAYGAPPYAIVERSQHRLALGLPA